MNLSAFIQVSSIVISMFYLLYLVYDLIKKEIREGREERHRQFERSREVIKESKGRLEKLELKKPGFKKTTVRVGDDEYSLEDPKTLIERYNIKRYPNACHKIDDSENTIDPFDDTQTAIRVDKNKGRLLKVIYEFAKE